MWTSQLWFLYHYFDLNWVSMKYPSILILCCLLILCILMSLVSVFNCVGEYTTVLKLSIVCFTCDTSFQLLDIWHVFLQNTEISFVRHNQYLIFVTFPRYATLNIYDYLHKSTDEHFVNSELFLVVCSSLIIKQLARVCVPILEFKFILWLS